MSAPNTEAFEAFVKAQTDFKSAIKDAKNPFFKSTYAPLYSIWEAVKVALSANGLMITQPIGITANGITVVRTKVRYKDGAIVEESECPVICKVQNDPQAMGSAITYARRYSLASILCVVTDDDDAESATRGVQPGKAAQVSKVVEPDLTDWRLKVDGAVDYADLNVIKKEIAEGKLDALIFKGAWGLLAARGKHLGFEYDTALKMFKAKTQA